MLPFHLDLPELIQTIGYFGIFFVVFAESGLFFGFFLPGDSLLFTAGFLASQGIFNITLLVPLVVIAAIGGDSAGFWMGGRFGKWLMNRKETFLFSKHNMKKAQEFYEKHGGKALILARFVPAVRTFVPIVAGMADMPYQKFISYNVVGGLIWGVGMTLAGYYLGKLIPDVDKYLLPIVGAIIILSVLPGVIHMRGEIKSYLRKHPAVARLLKLKESWLG
ncbi:VTT domain-containing protein [Candidatus Roizmanbacteria bacterium]|nr:VTT domain-containing protein [Candidatus Roizmanbacteria bacterium]